MIIGLNNQGVIRTLNNQKPKPSHYLLDHILMAFENLHMKQDKLMNASNFRKARCHGNQLIARTKGVVNLRVQWILGHKDFTLNEKADELAKQAAKGESSPGLDLPKVLRQSLPLSLSAIKQELKNRVQNKWRRWWKMSPCFWKMRLIDKSTPSKKWLKLVANLSRAQASLLFQLHSGHIGLNNHLHQIKQTA